MTRVIKFRAWDKKNKTMIYPDSDTDLMMGIDGVVLATSVCSHKAMFGYDLILMQFTGIIGKNDIEIYEGDIVKGNQSAIGKVKYQGLAFSYQGKKGDGSVWYDTITSNLKQDHDIEVIGNIYQNPNLI
jgi:uncharacterized phage protein (TIGR01671 family)